MNKLLPLLRAERRYTALWYMNAAAQHLHLARQYKRVNDRTNTRVSVELARMCNRMVCSAIYNGTV